MLWFWPAIPLMNSTNSITDAKPARIAAPPQVGSSKRRSSRRRGAGLAPLLIGRLAARAAARLDGAGGVAAVLGPALALGLGHGP